MRKLYALVLALVLALSLTPTAAAHDHPGLTPDTGDPPVRSDWAAEELRRAVELGLTDTYVDLSDTTVPIRRAEYCYIAMQYLQIEEQQDTFWSMVEQNLTEHDADGNMVNAFTDCAEMNIGGPYTTLAHAVGLVEGVGSGLFEPERTITRQEAAVMLARAYTALGGELPTGEATFSDMDQVADWAKDSIAAMQTLGVMEGVGNNTFSPLGTYSVEQCLVTFLRLYERAPVSAPNGNVERMFSYEQALDNLQWQEATGGGLQVFQPALLAECDAASFLRITRGAVMTYTSTLCLVNRDGRVTFLDPGVCNHDRVLGALTRDTEILAPAFSEDGGTLTFTIPIGTNGVTDPAMQAMIDAGLIDSGEPGTAGIYWRMGETPVLLHEAGNYLCTVDVDTESCTAERV